MTATKNRNQTKNLVAAGICLALCLLLPQLIGRIPTFGRMLLPMHLPVLLCGFVCGWPYALAVGIIAPLLSSLLFTMPPLVPTALCMAFELAAYGVATALLYRALPKKPAFIYVALAGAMLIGRAVWGVVSFFVYLFFVSGEAFSLPMFFAGAFGTALPGIITQLLLIPPIVLAMQRAKLID